MNTLDVLKECEKTNDWFHWGSEISTKMHQVYDTFSKVCFLLDIDIIVHMLSNLERRIRRLVRYSQREKASIDGI